MDTDQITEQAFKLLSDSIDVSETELSDAFNCSYNYWLKAKRSGRGKRLISEAQSPLKEVQDKILRKFFYQLSSRQEHIKKHVKKKREELHDLLNFLGLKNHPEVVTVIDEYVDYFGSVFDDRLKGLLPGTSYEKHPQEHAKRSLYTLYVTTMDFADAYPSVTKSLITGLLTDIFIKEIQYYKSAYIYGRKRRDISMLLKQCEDELKIIAFDDEIYHELYHWDLPYKDISDSDLRFDSGYANEGLSSGEIKERVKIREMLQIRKEELKNRIILSHGMTPDEYHKLKKYMYILWKDIYPLRFPLWGNQKNSKKSVWFRDLIHNEVLVGGEDSEEIAKVLAIQISELVTDGGVLPQGASTSGFLLCLAVSKSDILNQLLNTVPDRIPKSLSIYSDDIAFATGINPHRTIEGKTFVQIWENIINNSGIFTVNTEKTKVFDRRAISPAICGVRLNSIPTIIETNLSNYDKLTGKIILGIQRAETKKTPFRLSSISIPKKKIKQIRALFHTASFADKDSKVHHKVSGYMGFIHQIYGTFEHWPNQLKNPYIKYKQSRAK